MSTSRHFLVNFCNVSRSIGLIAGPAPTIWKTILAKVFYFSLAIRDRYWWGANRTKTVNGSIVRCLFCGNSVSRADNLNENVESLSSSISLRRHLIWWTGVCSSQLRMPLKYLSIRPSIKCSLGRCKLKDQTIYFFDAPLQKEPPEIKLHSIIWNTERRGNGLLGRNWTQNSIINCSEMCINKFSQIVSSVQ